MFKPVAKCYIAIIAMCMYLSALQGAIHHHSITNTIEESNIYIWEQSDLGAFDSLILSWNAARPHEGNYFFYVSLQQDSWSNWIPYAAWGKDVQSSFSVKNDLIHLNQHTLSLQQGKAKGFQIKIVAQGKADLQAINSLHVYTNADQDARPLAMYRMQAISLPVKGLSHVHVKNIYDQDVSVAVSTTAVVDYITQQRIDVSDFTQHVVDETYNNYENFVLNVAQAYTYCPIDWNCWVERLPHFQAIHQLLLRNIPVAVTLKKSMSTETFKEHMVVVRGYDPFLHQVLCMDPMKDVDHNCLIAYPFHDFMQAWEQAGSFAFVFRKL